MSDDSWTTSLEDETRTLIRMALTGIVLVTGGAGFIGSHIASALLASGARVRVLDDLSTGHRENIDEIGPGVDFVQGSVADPKSLNRALDGVELVFHEAAIPSVPRSVEDPMQTHIASVDGTFSLLLAARDRKVRRLIYAASVRHMATSQRCQRPRTCHRIPCRLMPLLNSSASITAKFSHESITWKRFH